MGAVTRAHQSIDLPRDATRRERTSHPRATDGDLQTPLSVDGWLLVAAQRGDREAFATVVQRHQGAVFGYLRSRLLEPADAEDICQEVFLRCFLGKARFDGSAALRPWLIGVARNVLREHIRKVTRRHEIVWTELCLELETMVEDDAGLYDDVMGHLPGCMESLGQSARHALELHYRDRFKIDEIAEKLHRSGGAVKLLMYRARQAVRRCLHGKVARQENE